jgi:hypothetical protein
MKPNVMHQVFLGLVEGRIHFGYFFGHDRKVFVAGIPGSQTRKPDSAKLLNKDYRLWLKRNASAKVGLN